SGLPTPGIDLNALALFLRNTQVNMPSITDPPGAGSGGIITLQQLAVNRHRLALSFATSMEHNAALINGYYQQFLGRNADASGLQGWLNFLALGGRAEDVLTGILRSDEYLARNGSTNDGFVKALYHDLLGRTASAAEVAGWVHALGTLSRAAVVPGLPGPRPGRGRTGQLAGANARRHELGRSAGEHPDQRRVPGAREQPCQRRQPQLHHRSLPACTRPLGFECRSRRLGWCADYSLRYCLGSERHRPALRIK
ncbi:MAG: DUF4214 domain-containing protein, partial [Planctomycetota bacterium]